VGVSVASDDLAGVADALRVGGAGLRIIELGELCAVIEEAVPDFIAVGEISDDLATVVDRSKDSAVPRLGHRRRLIDVRTCAAAVREAVNRAAAVVIADDLAGAVDPLRKGVSDALRIVERRERTGIVEKAAVTREKAHDLAAVADPLRGNDTAQGGPGV